MKLEQILILFCIAFTGCVGEQTEKNLDYRGSFSIDANIINISSPQIKDTVNIILLSDTHLSMKDDREKPYEQYSNRMAEAYKVTRHFETGAETNPRLSFLETVQIAKKERTDLLALLGDIVSYPSGRAIEWVDSVLTDSKLKYIYTTGNHDWYYEGMEGSLQSLRNTWIDKRLKPLYQEKNPLFYSIEVKGLKIVVIDNSTYEISAEQFDFFQKEAKSNMPFILMMHIPLYMPGRNVNYGCGHPNWNKINDNLYELERREPWSEEGHSHITMKFRHEVLNASNLLAVFAGHIHEQTLDVTNGLPLFVVKENASGNYFNIRICPK